MFTALELLSDMIKKFIVLLGKICGKNLVSIEIQLLLQRVVESSLKDNLSFEQIIQKLIRITI